MHDLYIAEIYRPWAVIEGRATLSLAILLPMIVWLYLQSLLSEFQKNLYI